jgi:hypothetical protein
VIGDVSVVVNDDFAPLLAVIVPEDPTADVQINFQVPLSANASLSSLYNYNYFGGGPVFAGFISVGGAVQSISVGRQWGGFFAQSNGVGVAFHASDSSLVTTENPARPGEAVVAYANDFFMTWPPPPIALPAPSGVPFQPDYAPVKRFGNLFLQAYPTLRQCPPAIPGGPCEGSVATTPAVKIDSMTLAPGLVGVEEIQFEVPQNQKPGNWALFFNDGSCPDGSGLNCGAMAGASSPYVMLPVGQ